jgi:phosphoglycolate phosphatase
MGVTSIIFDLDGTLIDSAPDIHAAVARALAEDGAPPLSFETVRGFIGNGLPILVERVIAARGEAPDPARRADLTQRVTRHYAAASSDLTTVYPGVGAALSWLQGQGHPMGICTNKPEGAARDVLNALGLEPFFQVVVGGETLPERKPHPAPLLAAQRLLGASSALYVGDSEVDAETAVAAGIPLLLFTQGYRKAAIADLPHRAAFSDFADLPNIVARFGTERSG